MPQLDASTYSSQLFWLFVSFSLLYLYVAMVAVPRIESLLELRWQNVEGNQLRADDFKKEADSLRAKYEAYLHTVRQKATDAVMQELQKINTDTAHQKKEMSAEVVSRIKATESRLALEAQKAQAEIQVAAEELTYDIIGKLIQTKIPESKLTQTVGDIFKESRV